MKFHNRVFPSTYRNYCGESLIGLAIGDLLGFSMAEQFWLDFLSNVGLSYELYLFLAFWLHYTLQNHF